MLSTQQQSRPDDQHTGPETPTEHQKSKHVHFLSSPAERQPKAAPVASTETNTLSLATRTLEAPSNIVLQEKLSGNEKLPSL